jgi:hypothetical protein
MSMAPIIRRLSNGDVEINFSSRCVGVDDLDVLISELNTVRMIARHVEEVGIQEALQYAAFLGVRKMGQQESLVIRKAVRELFEVEGNEGVAYNLYRIDPLAKDLAFEEFVKHMREISG